MASFPFLRAALAVVLLPGIVAFVVPLVLAMSAGTARFDVLGLITLVPGVILLLWCVREFYVVGKGTLAPWAPPVSLVATGPYRLSRNPMYVAVALILCGWAIAFRSTTLGWYALGVVVAFHLRVVLGEEPRLARAHGNTWDLYRARVPRWLGYVRRAAARGRGDD